MPCFTSFFLVFLRITDDWANIHAFSNHFQAVGEDSLFFKCAAQGIDVPLLAEEFIRAGVDFDLKKRNFVDVMSIFMKKEPRNLSAAYKFYCNGDLENAHSANADTDATYEVFKAQVERYTDIGNDIQEISKFSSYNSNADFMGRLVYDADHNVVINFGKYKGMLLTDVFRKDSAYYDWMMKGEFPLYTKKILTDEYMKFKLNSKK